MDAKTELLLYIASRRRHLVGTCLASPWQLGKSSWWTALLIARLNIKGMIAVWSEDIEWLNQFATDGLKPDLTLYFDLDVEGARPNCQKPRAGSQSFGFGRFGASPKSRTRLFGLVWKNQSALWKSMPANQQTVFADVLAVLENLGDISKLERDPTAPARIGRAFADLGTQVAQSCLSLLRVLCQFWDGLLLVKVNLRRCRSLAMWQMPFLRSDWRKILRRKDRAFSQQIIKTDRIRSLVQAFLNQDLKEVSESLSSKMRIRCITSRPNSLLKSHGRPQVRSISSCWHLMKTWSVRLASEVQRPNEVHFPKKQACQIRRRFDAVR